MFVRPSLMGCIQDFIAYYFRRLHMMVFAWNSRFSSSHCNLAMELQHQVYKAYKELLGI